MSQDELETVDWWLDMYMEDRLSGGPDFPDPEDSPYYEYEVEYEGDDE